MNDDYRQAFAVWLSQDRDAWKWHLPSTPEVCFEAGWNARRWHLPITAFVKDCFDAGWKARQPEIDELKKALAELRADFDADFRALEKRCGEGE